MTEALEGVLYGVEVVLGIGFLIFVHELGHFLVAKRVGVRVETFSLGFGPRLFGWRKTVSGRTRFGFGAAGPRAPGEEDCTDYRLSLVPLGGYVKMVGENPDEELLGDPHEFPARSVGERAAILAAGVTMNAVFAFVAFVVAFQAGVMFQPPVIGVLPFGEPAQESGLRVGDRVLAVDGTPVSDFSGVHVEVALADLDEGVTLTVEREGRTMDLLVYPAFDAQQGLPAIGAEGEQSLRIDAILGLPQPTGEDLAPARDVLRPGDRLVAIDGEPLASWADFEGRVKRRAGVASRIALERGGTAVEVEVTPAADRWPERIPFATLRLAVYWGGVHQVVAIKAGSPAQRAGLGPGDRVVGLAGQRMEWPALRRGIEQSGGREIDLMLERPGGGVEGDRAERVRLQPVYVEEHRVSQIGIEHAPEARIAAFAWEGGPAQAAGLAPGDVVVALDGHAVRIGRDVNEWLAASWTEGQEVDVEYLAGGLPGERRHAKVRPRAAGLLGVMPQKRMDLVQVGFLEACTRGSRHAVTMVKQIFLTLKKVVTRDVDTKSIGGPILIAKASFQFAQYGLSTLLFFMGILSLNLAVINALPVPVLDGGHLFFLLIEKLKGSPVSQGTLAVANYVGLVLLLVLMVFVTYQDIRRFLPN